MIHHINRWPVGALVGLVLLLASCAQRRGSGSAPFRDFVASVERSHYEDYAGAPGVRVEDRAAFEEMRANHL